MHSTAQGAPVSKPPLGSNGKGTIAEIEIAAAATRLGVAVLKPLGERGRYDLAFDLGRRVLRVQCKWARFTGAVVSVHLSGYRLTTRGQLRTTYSAEEIDAVAAYCDALDRCYLLPAALVAGRGSVDLRVEPPRNSQRAALHWAADFELPGAIAQLGERLRGTQEVAGSSPASSTHDSANAELLDLGAHEFRNRFGYYMERAAGGADILIRRHGKPFARLSPPGEPS